MCSPLFQLEVNIAKDSTHSKQYLRVKATRSIGKRLTETFSRAIPVLTAQVLKRTPAWLALVRGSKSILSTMVGRLRGKNQSIESNTICVYDSNNIRPAIQFLSLPHFSRHVEVLSTLWGLKSYVERLNDAARSRITSLPYRCSEVATPLSSRHS